MSERPNALTAIVLMLATAGVVVAGAALLSPTASPPSDLASSRQDAVGIAEEAGYHPPRLLGWVESEDFPTGIARFHTVFWDPEDTESLRRMIRETDLVRDKSVLEIGTGTGLIALCCLTSGANDVVATDINPNAIANAKFNAARFPKTSTLDVRQVEESDSGAFAVIRDHERFDLILSNPPWEDGKPAIVDDYALYDPEFQLIESLFVGLPDHLTENGRVLLAYGCVEAIRHIQNRAAHYGWEIILHDERSLDDLPNLFLPGMLLELRRQQNEG